MNGEKGRKSTIFHVYRTYSIDIPVFYVILYCTMHITTLSFHKYTIHRRKYKENLSNQKKWKKMNQTSNKPKIAHLFVFPKVSPCRFLNSLFGHFMHITFRYLSILRRNMSYYVHLGCLKKHLQNRSFFKNGTLLFSNLFYG